jgi:urease accessory protein
MRNGGGRRIDALTPVALDGSPQLGGWKAGLALVFRRSGEGTVLAERRHDGPLVVQKPLYPEGRDICHAVIVHAPGGIAGGDELALDVRQGPASSVLLTTPAAGKWYKANGRESRQRLRFSLGPAARLEWLPQETVLYDEAAARMETVVELDAGAAFAGWEITCFGRRASGETFAHGSLRQSTRIVRDGRLLWNERAAFAAGDRLMRSPVGLGGRHVSGTMVVAAGTPPPEALEACRALMPRDGEGGVTALPDILAARYLGASAEHAKDYFESLRAVLRPWYAGRPAARPRLWAT